MTSKKINTTIHTMTSKLNKRSYDIDGYDKYGFTCKGINRHTKTMFNPNGYDYDEKFYKESDYNIDGYDCNGFNSHRIHRSHIETGTIADNSGLAVFFDKDYSRLYKNICCKSFFYFSICVVIDICIVYINIIVF